MQYSIMHENAIIMIKPLRGNVYISKPRWVFLIFLKGSNKATEMLLYSTDGEEL